MYLALCPRTDPKQMSFTNPKGVKYLIISRRKKKYNHWTGEAELNNAQKFGSYFTQNILYLLRN